MHAARGETGYVPGENLCHYVTRPFDKYAEDDGYLVARPRNQRMNEWGINVCKRPCRWWHRWVTLWALWSVKCPKLWQFAYVHCPSSNVWSIFYGKVTSKLENRAFYHNELVISWSRSFLFNHKFRQVCWGRCLWCFFLHSSVASRMCESSRERTVPYNDIHCVEVQMNVPPRPTPPPNPQKHQHAWPVAGVDTMNQSHEWEQFWVCRSTTQSLI
jgi:hypothetical protein